MYAGQEVESAPIAEFFANPRHPYTARLLESLPNPSRPMREIGGEVPNLVFPPNGCRFHPRCGRASEASFPGTTWRQRHASGGALFPSVSAPAGGSHVSAMAPLLQVEKLRRHFPVRNVLGLRSGTIKALDDVTFAVRAGETFGIVGESGCGKTTLGKTLGRYSRTQRRPHPLRGRRDLELAGRSTAGVSQRLQYIHQDPGNALDPRWTIGRSLDEPLATHTSLSRSDRAARSREILAAVRLPAEHLHLYPHELSGGQQRRVGLARILTLKPRLVILDEPTSGLDVSIQATVLKLLQSLQKAFDLTYLFISHDLSVVHLMCNRVAVMYLGQIVEIAPVSELFTAARHPFLVRSWRLYTSHRRSPGHRHLRPGGGTAGRRQFTLWLPLSLALSARRAGAARNASPGLSPTPMRIKRHVIWPTAWSFSPTMTRARSPPGMVADREQEIGTSVQGNDHG